MSESQPDNMEAFIEQQLEQNYQMLRLERAGALSPNGINAARQQALYYWRKLRHIARRVTNTEVKLTLAGQESPDGNVFSIEGVVDIVREDERTTMYDIKTHEAEMVRASKDEYADQLNVYAYIWQTLHGQPLDKTAVIATRLPDALWRAIKDGDDAGATHEAARWDPLGPIPFDQALVDATVAQFARAVDAIEVGQFEPRPLAHLQTPEHPGQRRLFATDVCRNCDARFTCASYRAFAGGRGGLRGRHGRFDEDFRRFFGDYGPEEDLEDARDDNLAAMPSSEELLQDY
jgi:hypothetical protein